MLIDEKIDRDVATKSLITVLDQNLRWVRKFGTPDMKSKLDKGAQMIAGSKSLGHLSEIREKRFNLVVCETNDAKALLGGRLSGSSGRAGEL